MPVYQTWAAMHRRCYSSKDASYAFYGGRGIRVCERWNSVHTFLEDMGHPPEGMSIGRIDNDGHYEPANCRWETQEQQNENTCRNRYITWAGKTQTIKAWGQELDMSPSRISERLRRGWSVERTLTTPCPRGYEAGRAAHNAQSRKQWKVNGARYKEASLRRKAAKSLSR